MQTAALPPCSILLLAGGRGARLGGQDKGLVEWQGQPMIAWLHQAVRPLTDDLIISCNRNHAAYRPYADRLVSDHEPDYPGPLAGIRAGLAVARHPWLVVLPCDAPLVDGALIDRMRDASTAAPGKPLMVRQGNQWEPLFCVIPAGLAAEVERAWRRGERSNRRVLLALGSAALDIGQGDRRLANLNTADLLAAAAAEGASAAAKKIRDKPL